MTLSPTFNSLLDFLESVIGLLNSSRTSELDEAIKKNNNKNKLLTQQCGVLVWTQFSAVRLLSCRWQPG